MVTRTACDPRGTIRVGVRACRRAMCASTRYALNSRKSMSDEESYEIPDDF